MKINKDALQGTVDYSIDSIKYICNTYEPREPGSKGERDAQEYLAKDIKDNNWADEVKFEEFQVAPKAFMGFSHLIPIMIVIGLILFPLINWAPIVLTTLALIVLVLQFVMYKEFLDPFYKKSTSANLIATKKPTGAIKKRIIFSGHADAAYEWTLFYKFGPIVHIGGQVYAAIGAFVTIGLSILASIIGYHLWQLIVMILFIPGYVCLFLFSNRKIVVPGANDNLTGCLASVSALKYLKDANINYEHTEVVCLITGSEEAGLRGAKAWARIHKAECTDPNVETVFIGLETFRDLEHMSIYERDLSGTIKHNAKAIALLDKAASHFYDKPLPHASVYIGASDAAAITQAGITAVGLAAMDPAPARYYHTRNDTADNLSPKCFEAGMDLTIAAMEIFDKEGL